MIIRIPQPDRNAERVCAHKCALAAARTTSLGDAADGSVMPYLALNAAMTPSKYTRMAIHHARIRRIVLSSQHTDPSPATTFSIVSRLCRLYGTTTSGSS